MFMLTDPRLLLIVDAKEASLKRIPNWCALPTLYRSHTLDIEQDSIDFFHFFMVHNALLPHRLGHLLSYYRISAQNGSPLFVNELLRPGMQAAAQTRRR